jgi:large subunit ribosomal protein L5
MKENPMRKKIFVEKVVLNIGCAGNLEKIEKAKELLQRITGKKPVVTLSRKRSTFGIAKGKPIGVKVTLRKKEAEEFLKKVFEVYKNKIPSKVFDDWGNFSLGIQKYFELPGVKYDHKIGVLGMDVCVSLRRPGAYLKDGTLSRKQRVKKEEAIEFLKNKFGVEIV